MRIQCAFNSIRFGCASEAHHFSCESAFSHVFDPGNNLFTVKISGQTPGVIKNKKTGNQNSADYADMGL